MHFVLTWKAGGWRNPKAACGLLLQKLLCTSYVRGILPEFVTTLLSILPASIRPDDVPSRLKELTVAPLSINETMR